MKLGVKLLVGQYHFTSSTSAGRTLMSGQARNARGQFLIVGVAGHSLKEFEDKPEVILWKSGDTRTTRRPVPSSVRVILFTKNLGHDTFLNLRKEAQRIKATLQRMTSGRIRETLAGYGI